MSAPTPTLTALAGDVVADDSRRELASLSYLGQRIRELRRRNKLSLAEFSKLCEISVAMLSHIERGKTSPSLKSLDRIRNALGVPMTSLFPHTDQLVAKRNEPVVRADRREQLHFPDIGLVKQKLSPSENSDLEMLLLILEPGGSSGQDPWARVGEKAGLVLRGRMKLDIGDASYELSAGDSFQFDSGKPHRFANIGDERAEIVWIIKSSPLVRTVAV